LLLLEAEHLVTTGEVEAAKEEYEESIVSARSHRFIHDERLAVELLGECRDLNGNEDEAMEYKTLARATRSMGSIWSC
jgi:hypothetical protein